MAISSELQAAIEKAEADHEAAGQKHAAVDQARQGIASAQAGLDTVVQDYTTAAAQALASYKAALQRLTDELGQTPAPEGPSVASAPEPEAEPAPAKKSRHK